MLEPLYNPRFIPEMRGGEGMYNWELGIEKWPYLRLRNK